MQDTSSHSDTGDIHGRWFLAAILLSAIASGIHVLAAPEHFEEWVGYGLFFVVAAAGQGVYSVLLLFLGPGRHLLWVGIIGNVLIVALYVLTRTVGIPIFGPEAGEVEPVGLLDAASKVVELALIVCLVQLTRMGAAAENTSRSD